MNLIHHNIVANLVLMQLFFMMLPSHVDKRREIRMPCFPELQHQYQSSQIVSRLRSSRRSAPHTLHLFRLSLLEPYAKLRPRVGTSKLALFFESGVSTPSNASAAALICANLSASRAASSASGESGIVSKLEMLGLRDLADVGVDGIDERLPP